MRLFPVFIVISEFKVTVCAYIMDTHWFYFNWNEHDSCLIVDFMSFLTNICSRNALYYFPISLKKPIFNSVNFQNFIFYTFAHECNGLLTKKKWRVVLDPIRPRFKKYGYQNKNGRKNRIVWNVSMVPKSFITSLDQQECWSRRSC